MSLRFGVDFSGCGVAAFSALLVYLSSFCQRAAEDVLRRIMGPSLETGTVFDAALSGNYCAICDSVSVTAVQEKCDEKGRAFGSEKPMSETAVESRPFRRVCEKDGGTRPF